MKTNEIKIFDDYCAQTGGFPELQKLLEDSSRKIKTRTLEAENYLLRRLIE